MNYYDLLGLPKDATAEQIRNAYREMALKYHPDVNHSPDATIKMQEINSAYSTLIDPEMRKQYDSGWSTTINDSYQTSYTQSTSNFYTINTNEVWSDLFDNLGKYNMYTNDNSDYGRKMRSDVIVNIIRDGLNLLFGYLDKK
jgi:DnaJ-class molecular chaperone